MSPQEKPVVTSLAERMIKSPMFTTLFRTNMNLVEELAAYLDGPGKNEVVLLAIPAQFAYAKESMHLTARLMKITSWTLLHRAVVEGERTLDEVITLGVRIDVSQISFGQSRTDLPKTMQDLIVRTNALALDVIRLDGIFHPKCP